MIWSRSKRTILIISPPATADALHAGFLQQSDLHLIHAAEEEALDLARRERPCLIVDQIDDGNGPALDLCRRLKADARTRRIPLISIVPPGMSAAAERAGSDVWLRQPLVQDEYFDAIRRFVRLPRRRHPRLATNLRVSFELDGTLGQAFTRNISLTGALLKTDRRVANGSRIHAVFSVPGQSSAIRCDALVHRTDPDDEMVGPATGFAIEFLGMSAEDHDRLREFLTKRSRRAYSLFA